jgi:hypothetical protein
MDLGVSFFSRQSSDARDSPEGQALLRYVGQLREMSHLFLYEVDLREITVSNIDEWEAELRGIIKGIENLRDAPYTPVFLTSCDGVQKEICDVIDNLYSASDILQKRSPTIKDRKVFYQTFRHSSVLLSKIIDLYFQI